MKKDKKKMVDDEPEYFVEQVDLTPEIEKEISDFIRSYRSTKEKLPDVKALEDVEHVSGSIGK